MRWRHPSLIVTLVLCCPAAHADQTDTSSDNSGRSVTAVFDLSVQGIGAAVLVRPAASWAVGASSGVVWHTHSVGTSKRVVDALRADSFIQCRPRGWLLLDGGLTWAIYDQDDRPANHGRFFGFLVAVALTTERTLLGLDVSAGPQVRIGTLRDSRGAETAALVDFLVLRVGLP